MSITCSNIPRQLKKEMQQLIEANGNSLGTNTLSRTNKVLLLFVLRDSMAKSYDVHFCIHG
jgi:uncharacterized protein YbcI